MDQEKANVEDKMSILEKSIMQLHTKTKTIRDDIISHASQQKTIEKSSANLLKQTKAAYENISKKEVEDKMVEPPPPVFDFDTTTKPEGTQNAKVNQRIEWEAKEKQRIAEDQMLKGLPTLEKEAQEVLLQEVIVVIGKEFLDKRNEVFESCKEKGC